MKVNEKLCKKHCIKSSSNICFGYLLESPQRGDSNKYPKHMFDEEIRIKQSLSYISFYPLRILLLQQIHYNGNISGNKCCHCNEGSLYLFSSYLYLKTYVVNTYYKCLAEALLMNTHNTVYVFVEIKENYQSFLIIKSYKQNSKNITETSLQWLNMEISWFSHSAIHFILDSEIVKLNKQISTTLLTHTLP